MIYVEHRHAIRSSAFLALYLFFTVCADSVKSRSYFLRPGMDALGGLAATTASLRICLIVLEEISKKALLLSQETRDASQYEDTCGYFQRAFFIYLYPILMAGFRGNLTSLDVDKLGAQFSSQHLHSRLKKNIGWMKKSKAKFSLIRVCMWTWKWELLSIMVPRLANIGASFGQAFLLRLVIGVAEADAEDNQHTTASMRAGIIGVTFLLFMAQTMTKSASAHFANQLVTQVRGGLIAEMMGKAHRLKKKDANSHSVLTHTSSDIESIATGLVSCADIPMTMMELGVGVYFLFRLIGQSCFFVILPVMGSSLFSFSLGFKTGPLMAAWNKAIEARVSQTSQILQQLPEVKMQGLASVVQDRIHNLRVQEMRTSKPYRLWMGVLNMTTSFTDAGTPVVVLAAAYFWRGFNHKLSSAQVFPTLAIVGLIQTPTVKSLQVYTELMGMIACFDRVQSFLQLPERQDSRIQSAPSTLQDELSPMPAVGGTAEMQPQAANRNTDTIIHFSNASLGPTELPTALLTDVNFALVRGSISGVLGNTGTGKSTLFDSILGEAKNTNGFVYTDEVNIAYCSTDVWLKDASIRDNIVGFLPFDSVRYEVAIRSCLLEHDLSQLAERDHYIVGTNGARLSGGQRQRVALARAVFADCEINIFDDCFSALDRSTAVAILTNLCGENGVFRSVTSAVLLATYLPESLRVIDQLITIDADGHVLLDRNFASNAEHAKLMNRLLKATASDDSPERHNTDAATVNNVSALNLEPESHNSAGLRKYGNWGLYMLFIRSVGKLRFALLNFLAFLMAGSELTPEIYLRVWTEVAPENGSWFAWYALMAGGACAITGVTYWILYTIIAVRAAINLHAQMLDVTMRAPLAIQTQIKTGDLLNRFSQDANLFAKILPFYFYRTMYMFYSVFILIGIILSSATYLCILLPVIFLSIFYIQRFYLQTSRQMRHLDIEEKAPLYTYLNETAAGLSHIRAFGWIEKNLRLGYELLDNSQKPFYFMLCIQQWLGFILGVLTTAIAVALVSVVLFASETTSPSAIGLSFLSLLNLQRTLVYLIEAWTGSETSVACLARLKDFQESTPQEPQPDLPQDLPKPWPAAGAVELTEVSSGYGILLDAPTIVKEISLVVGSGMKVGIFGRSGSGKSSLLLTVLGMLSHTGTIKIDGLDIVTIKPDALREYIITITQHPVQFDDTIRANLLPFRMNDDRGDISQEQRRHRDAEDAALVSVLDRLQLWRKVRDRGGLDAKLTDAGYSKGEMQLLSIARAIMRRRDTNSNLILVDEATSSLDPERDRQTQEILDEEFDGCTVITVAHRLETIQNVDQKWEMSGGKLTQLTSARQGTK